VRSIGGARMRMGRREVDVYGKGDYVD
jgi:hypothetical protein